MRKAGKKLLSSILMAAMTVSMLPQSVMDKMFSTAVPMVYAEEGGAATSKTLLTDEEVEKSYTEISESTVSVHDPSIIAGTDKNGKKCYYIFGSHMAWAKSYDLVKWETFENNINKDYRTLFNKEGAWSALGNSSYDISGNLWAPDVIWNKDMNKWCMYMSVNGLDWNSSICLLTADNLEGDWTYSGTVVYSGFGTDVNDWKKTDYAEVTGDSTGADIGRYTNGESNWYYRYGAHAIDPCVFYDEDGVLWMSYGSWSGGIYMFQLDKATGLRDKSKKYTYSTSEHTDPYMGKKIGGSSSSGEASYIQYINGRYYLFLSYGGLVATGGYNMRVFSSDKPDGPYVDAVGKAALDGGSVQGNIGTRLMAYYKWSWMKNGRTAQGHNSAFVDDDGKAYVVYHTRTDDGTEGHFVRAHQLFTTKSGYLVSAPFQYNTTDNTAYDNNEIAGTYETILHASTAITALETNKGKNITLTEDGKITGAYTGTWEKAADGNYITLNIGADVYEGVMVNQTREETNQKSLCFTAVGSNDLCLWGSKLPDSEVSRIAATVRMVGKIPGITEGNLTLSTENNYNTTVKWTSSNEAVISSKGIITRPEKETEVILTLTVESENYTYTKNYTVIAKAADDGAGEAYLVAEYLKNEVKTLPADNGYSISNPYTNINISNGVSIKFDVQRTGKTVEPLSTIIAFNGSGRLYFCGASYLGFNNGKYFDANLKNYGLVKDFLGTEKCTVELRFLPEGYRVYVNDKFAYSNESLSKTTAVSGDLTNYGEVLDFIRNGCKDITLGTGAWWGDAKFTGTVSNIQFFAYPVETMTKDLSLYECYEDFENVESVTDIFTSANLAGGLSIGASELNHYLEYKQDGSSGNRGAMSKKYKLDKLKEYSDYTISFDLAIRSGNVVNRSLSQFVIADTNCPETNSGNNGGISSDYILKLQTGPSSNIWTINDSTQTVELPELQWVHFNLDVTPEAKTAVMTITKENTQLYSGTINMPENGTGIFDSVYILSGRGNGLTMLDNLKVFKKGAEDELELKELTISKPVVPDVYSGYKTEPIITYTITNTGNRTLTDIKAVLEKNENFVITQNIGKTTLQPGESTTASVKAASGLKATSVSYADKLILTAENGSYKRARRVSLTVNECMHTYLSDYTGKRPANCTSEGYTGDRKCLSCNVVFKGTTVEKTAHQYKQVTTKATVAKNGCVETKCTTCGKAKSSVVIYRPKSVSVSKTSYIYDGKAKKPTVSVKDSKGKKISASYYTVSYSGNTKPGTAKVTVTFKGIYSGKMTKTYKIALGKPALKNVISPKKNQLKVTLKSELKNVTGYEVRYITGKTSAVKTVKSTSKTMTIKNLKSNKKYKVKICAYKIIGGRKYRSAWTTYSKAVKIK